MDYEINKFIDLKIYSLASTQNKKLVDVLNTLVNQVEVKSWQIMEPHFLLRQ